MRRRAIQRKVGLGMYYLSLVIFFVILFALALALFLKKNIAFVIVLLNLGVFCFQLIYERILGQASAALLGFSPSYVSDISQADYSYTLITSLFTHANFFHLLMNLLGLIIFGIPLQARIGNIRFSKYYFLSGIGAAIFYSLGNWGVHLYLIGASGCVFGILGAYASLYPNEKMSLLLFFIPLPPMRIRYLALLYAGIELILFIISIPGDTIAHLAHLGGLIVGGLLGLLDSGSKGRVFTEGSNYSINKEKTEIDIESLSDLNQNHGLDTALEELSKPSALEVQNSWIDLIEKKGRCRKCTSGVRREGDVFRCSCGKEYPIFRKR
ncbi:MAG: rhomboid family intramembrane serine protease [Thermoplasmata archaeon]